MSEGMEVEEERKGLGGGGSIVQCFTLGVDGSDDVGVVEGLSAVSRSDFEQKPVK